MHGAEKAEAAGRNYLARREEMGRIIRRGAVESVVRVRHEVVDVAVMPLENGPYLLFRQQYPTGACVAGNGGVRSPRDNLTSSRGMAAEA